MSLKVIKSCVQFSRGTSLTWSAMTVPLPAGVLSFSIDDGTFKFGDGVSLYNDLPALFTYADLISAQGGASGMFATLTAGDNGKIVIAYFDESTNVMKYAPSSVTLADLLASVNTLETTNSSQDTAIATLLAIALDIDVSINTGSTDNIVVVSNGRYSDSGLTVAAIRNQIASQITYVPGYQMLEPVFYADAAMTSVVDRLSLQDDSTYYVNIPGFNNSAACTFSLSAANANVAVSNVSGSLFQVKLNKVTANTNYDTPIVLIATVGNSGATTVIRKALTCLVMHNKIIAAVYGGSSLDLFRELARDASGNIYAVGRTLSEGTAGEALIVKYDSNLNIVARKVIGGSALDYFTAVAIDSVGNAYVVGYSVSENASGTPIIIRFDSTLTMVYKKKFTTSSGGEFLSVGVDSSDNIFACGWTASEGAGGSDAIIVKMNNSFSILYKRVYGGTGTDIFQKLKVDSAGNVICVGDTTSEGTGTPITNAIIVKYDTTLTLVARKVYGGTGADSFVGVTTDSNNNIYVTGNTASEGPGTTNGILVKLDSNMNVLATKLFGQAGGAVTMMKPAVDAYGNIIIVGSTTTEGLGLKDGYILKLDSAFNVLKKKRYGGSGDDIFNSVVLDSAGNMYVAGQMSTNSFGDYDALVVKLPSEIPVGTYSATLLSGLVLADCSTMNLSNAALTLSASALTDAASTMTLTNTTVVASATSGLSFIRDFVN